ncbi:MAG: 50S ribosomal protein L15 [Candidatus Omnitrophica bacterium]|nr:50S ribosomal protein L15 [Candidatus Omnitrophota bacterium]
MKLHNLLPPYGEKHKVKRLGRGNSSGSGNYSGRGMKGQGSRKGRVNYLGFEGGQMPLYRRLPKRGFTPLNKERYQEVNLCSLNSLKDEKEITPEILRKKGLIKKVDEKIKILGKGTLELTLVVKAHEFSRRAKEEIVKKGGKAIEIVSYKSKLKVNKEEVERNKVTVKESLAEKEQKTKEKTKEVKTAKVTKGKEKTEIKPKIIKKKKSLKSKDKAKTKGKKKDK